MGDVHAGLRPCAIVRPCLGDRRASDQARGGRLARLRPITSVNRDDLPTAALPTRIQRPARGAALPGRGPHPRLPGRRGLATAGHRRASRRAQPQHGDGAAPLQGGPPRRALCAHPGAVPARPGGGTHPANQVGNHPGSRGDARRADRHPRGPARGGRRPLDPGAVPASVRGAPAGDEVLPPRRVRRAGRGGPPSGVRPRGGGAARAQLVPRQAAGGRRAEAATP
jgi:hypothetical protein